MFGVCEEDILSISMLAWSMSSCLGLLSTTCRKPTLLLLYSHMKGLAGLKLQAKLGFLAMQLQYICTKPNPIFQIYIYVPYHTTYGTVYIHIQAGTCKM